MDYFRGIAGHKNQLEFLNRSAESGRLAHAYIFSGPAGVGKHAVATALARKLLCEGGAACGECVQCRMITAGSNPDLIEVASEETIKIEQVRELAYKLSLKSYAGGNKIAIIDPAELMTTEAANALLKAMEEPAPSTHIILITSNAYRLLPTISSRAQKVNFGLVPEMDYRRLLPSELDQKKTASILDLAAGRPGVAVRLVNDEAFEAAFEDLEKTYQVLSGSDPVAKLQSVYELAEREPREIRSSLEYLLVKLEKDLLKTGAPGTAARLDGLSSSLRYLAANANPKLFLFNLLLNF